MKIESSITWDMNMHLRRKLGLLDQAFGFCRTYEITKWLFHRYKYGKKIYTSVDTPETLILLNTTQIQSVFLPNLVAKNYLPSQDFLDSLKQIGESVSLMEELELDLYKEFEDFYSNLNRYGVGMLDDLKYNKLDIIDFKMNLQDTLLAIDNQRMEDFSEKCLVSMFLAEHAIPTVLTLYDRMDNEAEPIAVATLFKFPDDVLFVEDVFVNDILKLGLSSSFRLKIIEFAVRNRTSKLVTKDVNFLPLNIGNSVKNAALSHTYIV